MYGCFRYRNPKVGVAFLNLNNPGLQVIQIIHEPSYCFIYYYSDKKIEYPTDSNVGVQEY